LLPPELSKVSEGDKVFPYFIVNNLPYGMTGLLIASVFAAGMSTVSTSINSTATILLSDYYKRYINKDADEGSSMKVLYGSSLFFGFLGTLIALAMVGVESVLDAWWGLASVFSGGMLGLFLLGYLSDKVRNIDAVIGVIIGVLVITWMSLSPVFFTEGNLMKFKSPFHNNLTIVFGTMAISLSGFLLTKLFSEKR